MFRTIAEGDVFSTREKVTCSGSRTAVLPDGRLICVFSSESGSGVNDFVPMASYSDDGVHWSEAKPIWPGLTASKSMTAVVRPTQDGRVSLCGIGFEIDRPGENWWIDELAAFKKNWLIWSVSEDGYHFPEPQWLDPVFPCGAENPGGMLVEEDGSMTLVYSPYPLADDPKAADTNCLVLMRSSDGGRTFSAEKISKVEGPSEYAEAWIDRLSDGTLMISVWQTASRETSDQYLLSFDGGKSFSGPFAQPFSGQSTALTAWKEGTALIVYNQRKEQPAGVRLARARPDKDGYHLLEDQLIWEAQSTTRNASSGDFSQWTDFSFGEPHVTVLPDGKLLATLWYEQGDVKGIRYLLLEHVD